MFSALVHLLAQTTPADPGINWQTIFSGIITSSPLSAALFWRLSKSDKDLAVARLEFQKEIAELRDEIKQGHQQALDLTRQVVPLLERTVETLSTVRDSMAGQVARSKPFDTEAAFDRLQSSVAALGKGAKTDV